MKRYTESHEWAEEHGEKFRIGISQFAQGELGEIVYVELPPVGAQVEADCEAAILESTKAASDVYSPLSGKVTAVNTRVKENPALLNDSPESEGWLFEIEATSPFTNLMKEEEYRKMLGLASIKTQAEETDALRKYPGSR